MKIKIKYKSTHFGIYNTQYMKRNINRLFVFNKYLDYKAIYIWDYFFNQLIREKQPKEKILFKIDVY